MAAPERKKIRLDPFIQMLTDLSNEITAEKFKALKNMLSDKIPRRDLERMSEPFDLFTKLRDRGDISENNTQLLDEIMRSIGLSAVYKDILGKFTGSANQDIMAISLSFEDKPEVGLWEKFLINMSKEMNDDELRSAKVAAKKAIGWKGFEEITDATTFFNTLEKGGYINEDDTHYLEEIFESIPLKNVMKEVEEYKKSRAEYVSRRRELANTQNVDFVGEKGT
ncbi:caspase-8-like isoform X2 [Ptychodera flava]|uniref:caspase-8-like isoform X2 n=1 Tax=Ptychodera flava TaxID=63121 RepID=UPI00396A40A5